MLEASCGGGGCSGSVRNLIQYYKNNTFVTRMKVVFDLCGVPLLLSLFQILML